MSASETVDYQTLDLRASQIAELLRSRGIRQGSLVGICLPRSVEFVVASLAAWKAGAAYLPIDPSYPAERVTFLLEDAGVSAVIDATGIESRHGGSVDPGVAYVIYTSGSTGKPNGVEVTHSNVAHLCRWHQRAFGITATDRAMFGSSPGFDAAVWEIWPYVAAGASLYLPDEITRRSPELLRDWLLAQRITIAFVPTPLAEEMLNLEWPREASLRTLLTGADVLHRFPPPGLPFELVNNYGPTECTVVATSGKVAASLTDTGRPTIGRPVSHAEIHIVDDEIWIGGKGVARGYRNRPELTAARFVDGRYRTGDLGRMLPNGEIEFLGRKDEQIKIRGYRVELNEIVSALDRHRAVRCSTVIFDGSRLIAYVVPRGEAPGVRDLHDFLRRQLPEYMIPATYVSIDQLPVTAHGKIDRSRLPEPAAHNTLSDAKTAAESDVQKQVSEVLTKLLKTPNVGLDDNFFMLGGHSLLGTQLIVRLRERFDVDLSLLTLFGNPTARSLAAEIERLLADDMAEV